MNAALLEVRGLRIGSSAGEIVRGVDLSLARGETVGIFGESGCGKTTLGLGLVGVLDPARRVVGGEILFDGAMILGSGVDKLADFRGNRIGFIPQDPFSSFDPLRRVGNQISRPLVLHHALSRREAKNRSLELLARLGVENPKEVFDKFPHQLSGGLRQRAVIASALSCEPDLVIADEPTTALDVLVQAQVLNTFLDLVKELGSALVLITHDLSLLVGAADRVAAMYAGRIVESGRTRSVLATPGHPYTAALLGSLESLKANEQRLETVGGHPPSLPGPLEACAFAPRCPRADSRCVREEPSIDWPATDGVACHHPLRNSEALVGLHPEGSD